LTAVAAFAQIKQGEAQAAGLKSQGNALLVKADFTKLKGRQDALKDKTKVVQGLQAILENLARVTAVAAAGNVDAFTGSAVGAKNKNLNVGGLNVVVSRENSLITQLLANDQARQFEFQAGQAYAAAGAARQNGITSALFTLGMGLFQFGMLGGFGGPTAGGVSGGAAGAGANAGGSFGGIAGGGFAPISTAPGNFGVAPPISPNAVSGYPVTTFGA
jgi:hypothetical protein